MLGVAAHFALVLTHPGYLGVDGGAYWLSVNAVLGDEPTGAGFPRPPLAPGWLLVPFVEILGFDLGYKIWSGLVSLAPAVPVYLFAHRIKVVRAVLPRYSPAIFAVGFLLLDLLHAEMLVTGALPLLAFGLLGTVWWGMFRLTEDWDWRAAVVMAICLGLIPWVNQTTAGLAIITLPVFGLALLWFNRQDLRIIAKRWLIPLAAGGALALAALPWYTTVLPVSGVLNYPGPFVYLTPWTDSSWLQLGMGWALGGYLWWRAGVPVMRALGVLIAVLGTLTVFLSTDETVINLFYRSRYLIAIPFYIGITWVVFNKWMPRSRRALFAPVALGVLAAAFMLVGYTWQFNNQAGYSRMVSGDMETALDLIDDDKAIINNSFTLALWISARQGVDSPHTWTWQPPPTWQGTDLHVRCVLGWYDCDPQASAENLGAGWVLIEKRFPYYNNRAPGVYLSPNVLEPWADLPNVPWLTLMYARGTTELWRIAF